MTVADMDASGSDTADAIVAAGCSASFVRCDITSNDDVRTAVEAAAGDGGLHILVNNAGIFPTTGPVANVTDEFVHRMLDVNVRAQYSVTRDATSAMTSGGSVVNLASIAGLRGGAEHQRLRHVEGGSDRDDPCARARARSTWDPRRTRSHRE